MPEYVERRTFTGDTPTARWIGWRNLEGFPKWIRKSDYPRCPARGHIPDMPLQFEVDKARLGMAIVSCFIADREPALMRAPPGRLGC
jgi:hypothetical protein